MQVHKEQVAALLQQVLSADKLKGRQLTETDNLLEYGLNSLTFVQFIVLAEEEFGIEISDEDLGEDQLTTIADIVKMLSQY